MPESVTEALRDLWTRQQAWSRAANRAKAEVSRYRTVSLFLVVAAAALGAAAPAFAQVNDRAGRTCGLVAGVSLGLIPIVRRRLGAPMYETWSRLRSISEALKVEVYSFLAGVDPYRDEGRNTVLRTRGRDILQKGDDLLDRLRRTDQRPRDLPAVTDIESYLQRRVAHQIDTYYLPQAHRMARRARQMRSTQALLAMAAVILGVFASTGQTQLAPWIGVIGTISGALIAHSAAARYSFLQLEYFRTAEQLTRIVADYRQAAAPGPDPDDWVVHECERVISFQNEAWMAELVMSREGGSEATIPPPV